MTDLSNSAPKSEKISAGRFARAGRALLVVTSVALLLFFAAQLDPRHNEQVARDAEAAKIREAREAKLVALDKKTPAPAHVERLNLNFTNLSFVSSGEPLDPKTQQPHYAKDVPALIKSYDGREVRIRGFMLPVKMEGNEVRDFMILASQMSCCYGTPPRFWEFIVVHKKGDAAPNLMDTPLTFEGVLHVGDVYESGYWTQFYTMDCTDVIR